MLCNSMVYSHIAKKGKCLWKSLVALLVTGFYGNLQFAMKSQGCYEITGCYKSQWFLLKANSYYKKSMVLMESQWLLLKFSSCY